MAHGTMSMVSKKSPAKCFGGMVGNVDKARDVMHDDDSMMLPLLNGKMLNVNMPGAGSGFALIDHGNGGDVVLVEQCWSFLGNTEFMKDGTKVFGNLGSMHSSNELSLGGTCSNSGLKFGLVGNGTTSKTEYNTSERALCVSVSGIGCINKANKL